MVAPRGSSVHLLRGGWFLEGLCNCALSVHGFRVCGSRGGSVCGAGKGQGHLGFGVAFGTHVPCASGLSFIPFRGDDEKRFKSVRGGRAGSAVPVAGYGGPEAEGFIW